MRSLYCKRRQDHHHLSNEEYNYINSLIESLVNDDALVENLGEDTLDSMECEHISEIITEYLEKNYIFEIVKDGIKRPFICKTNNLPDGVEALSMNSLSMLSNYTGFLKDCRYGMEIIVS